MGRRSLVRRKGGFLEGDGRRLPWMRVMKLKKYSSLKKVSVVILVPLISEREARRKPFSLGVTFIHTSNMSSLNKVMLDVSM